jgi:hypothetical protein
MNGLSQTHKRGVAKILLKTGQTITNLTNLPTMPADWITASGLKTDAITKIQNGLALEATLTAIKGARWTDQTLVALMTAISAITGMDIAEIAVAVWANSTRTLTGQSANVSVISPVVKDVNIPNNAGDDYKEIDGRALVWSSTDWPDLTGSDILFVCKNGVIEMKVLASGVGEQSIQLELSTIDTANLKGTLYFYIRAVLATGNIATLVAGKGSCE